MSEPRFLTLDEVFHIHAQSLAEHGGSDGVRALIFLAMNGFYVQPPTWKLYSVVIDVAEKKKTKADLAEIFRECAW